MFLKSVDNATCSTGRRNSWRLAMSGRSGDRRQRESMEKLPCYATTTVHIEQ